MHNLMDGCLVNRQNHGDGSRYAVSRPATGNCYIVHQGAHPSLTDAGDEVADTIAASSTSLQ